MAKKRKKKNQKKNSKARYSLRKEWAITRVTGKEYQELSQDSDLEFSSLIGDWIVDFTEAFDDDEELIETFKHSLSQIEHEDVREFVHYTDSATDISEIDDWVNEYFDFDASTDFFESAREKLCGTHVIMSREGDYLGASFTIKDSSRNLLCSLNSIYGIAVILNENGVVVAPYRNDKLMKMAYSSFKDLYKALKSCGQINPPGISRYCS